jgi:ubiquinone/menaquinone biosynthesis C-methylase UbiE
MKKSILEKNKEYSEKFIQPMNNLYLSKKIKEIIDKENIQSIVDLGCGDGNFIRSVKKEYPQMRVVGVDISPRRINGLKVKFPEDKFYIRDCCDTKLKETFDLVYSSQVIEHVSNDKKMIEEMFRLLKRKGILYCSSVIKKPWAIYKYRNNGRFVLDPTHEREYKNEKDFLKLFKKKFKLISYDINKTKRKKCGIKFRIPEFYEISGIWSKR